MLWIGIRGLEERFFRNLELLASLFYEEVKVRAATGEEEHVVQFHIIEEKNLCRAEARLTQGEGGEEIVASFTREWEAQMQEQDKRKRRKQTIDAAFLQAYQKLTGVEQPWGILTGVRPVKLYHSFVQKGMSPAEIKALLTTDYLIHPTKVDLIEEIVERQLTVLPDLYEIDQEVSLYIGIPFCPTKCAYCTFPAYAIRGRNGSVEEFLLGLQEEIRSLGAWIQEKNLRVTTIYFGGGTPTSITAEQMEELFVEMERSIPGFHEVRELTVEAGRPDTLSPDKIELMKKWKVDRISINPQSFKEDTLKLIGRHHTVKETLEKYQLAMEMGLTNINMDLIIGLPNEGVSDFARSLEIVEKLRPESITVHTLSFKRGSHMSQNKTKYTVADRYETAEMVQMARDWTIEKGYVPYYLYRQKNILGNQENVGYALPSRESLYNILIMEERQTIIGLGCGAVSKIVTPGTGAIDRLPNPKEPQAYIDTYREHIQEKITKLNEIYAEKPPTV